MTLLASNKRSDVRLTPQERRVAGLACRGLTNKEIARKIGISEGVVKLHLHRVYWKLGVEGRVGLKTKVTAKLSGQENAQQVSRWAEMKVAAAAE